MSKWLNKGLYAVIAVISVMCIFLYISKQSLEHDISVKNNTISNLTIEVKDYKKRLFQTEELNRELDESVSRLRKIHGNMDITKTDTIQEIDRITKGNVNENVKKQNESGVIGDPLDPDLVRVLDVLCERVRGSSCPSPNP